MGWREILGAKPEKAYSKPHMQKVQNIQKVEKEANYQTFAPSALIAPIDEKLKLQNAIPETRPIIIEKMSTCLHGSWCKFIACNGSRQICRKNDQPIFDMVACPEEKWWRMQH